MIYFKKYNTILELFGRQLAQRRLSIECEGDGLGNARGDRWKCYLLEDCV